MSGKLAIPERRRCGVARVGRAGGYWNGSLWADVRGACGWHVLAVGAGFAAMPMDGWRPGPARRACLGLGLLAGRDSTWTCELKSRACYLTPTNRATSRRMPVASYVSLVASRSIPRNHPKPPGAPPCRSRALQLSSSMPPMRTIYFLLNVVVRWAGTLTHQAIQPSIGF